MGRGYFGNSADFFGKVASGATTAFKDVQDWLDVEGRKGVADPNRESSSYDQKQAALAAQVATQAATKNSALTNFQNRPTNPNGSSATINRAMSNLAASRNPAAFNSQGPLRNNANALANLNLDGLTGQLNTPATAANARANAAAQQQRLQDIAFASAEFGAPTQTRVATNMGQANSLDLSKLESPTNVKATPITANPITPVTPVTPVAPVAPVVPVTPVAPVAPVAPVNPGPTVDQSLRGLFGELSTQDFTQQIKDLMAEREAGLVGLNKQSLDQLAAGVALRTTQIGDISKALTESLGTLDADRTGQQANLFATVAKRAQEMLTGVETNISDARTGLGPQVTDEFEQVAQLVSGLTKSQGASSNDAMARLGQISNMAATERLAAPASLAAESKLALSDQEFNYKNQLQTALKEGLLGLGEEETARLFNEAMRQEEFGNQRDSDMMQALVNNTLTQDARKYQSAEAEIGRNFQSDEALLGREFQGDQAGINRAFQSNEASLGRNFTGGQNELNRQASRDAAAYSAANQLSLQNDAQKFTQDQQIIENEVAATAAAAEEDGLIAAANYVGIDPITYKGMSSAQRLAASNSMMEQQKLIGQGAAAAPPGTLLRLREMYPKVDDAIFVHVQSLVGLRAEFDNDPASVDGTWDSQKDGYLNKISETADYQAYALNSSDRAVVDQLYTIFQNELDINAQILSKEKSAAGALKQSDKAIASGRGTTADSILSRR